MIIVDNSLDFSKYDLKTIPVNTKIFTLDLESHSQLNDLNISHEKLDLYLTSDDKIFIENHSIKIALEWYKIPEINELLKFDQLNLGSLFEQDLYLFRFFQILNGYNGLNVHSQLYLLVTAKL